MTHQFQFSVSALQEAIARRLKIEVSKQVLLISSGQVLSPKTKLVKYGAGTVSITLYYYYYEIVSKQICTLTKEKFLAFYMKQLFFGEERGVVDVFG